MTSAPSLFTAFLTGTSTPVDYFQPSDMGETFDFVMTFAEGMQLSGDAAGISGSLNDYTSPVGVYDPGGGTTITIRLMLDADLSQDVAEVAFALISGFESVSGEPLTSSAITLTDQYGAPLEFRMGTTPEITTGSGSNAYVNVNEGNTFVTNVDATDDGETDPSSLTYTLSGADAAFFSIDSSTGELQFVSAPNYESPQDSNTNTNTNNIYTVTVTATDVIGQSDSQLIYITVQDINDDPTGSVTLSGTATEDQTLTAANTLADEDGLGTITYQWQRGGVDIAGASNSSYMLTQDDVGAVITVTASYTDDQGTVESVRSAATATVRYGDFR